MPGPASAPNDPAPRRVAVVDNSVDSADSLAALLRLLGMDVHVAYGGRAALETLRSFAPTVVFLDIAMPEIDGYEVARSLRQMPELAEAVLVAVTGWGDPDDRRRSSEAGFDHHLVKPLDCEALQAVLASPPRRREPGD